VPAGRDAERCPPGGDLRREHLDIRQRDAAGVHRIADRQRERVEGKPAIGGELEPRTTR